MTTPASATGLAAIDHVVVLMRENRWFDHLLGFRYAGGGNVSPDWCVGAPGSSSRCATITRRASRPIPTYVGAPGSSKHRSADGGSDPIRNGRPRRSTRPSGTSPGSSARTSTPALQAADRSTGS
jgi:hypothetical protein